MTEQTPPEPAPRGRGPGFFVAFEGGDGAGKSTQSRLLGQWLTDQGYAVRHTREPGGTGLGRQVRELLLHGEDGSVSPRAEALLFAADRAHHVASVVRPALQGGGVVLTDRYLDSSVAYQGAARALGHDEVRKLSMWAVEGLVPDLTVLLDVSAREGRARRGEVHDRLEREADDFHDRVRQGFLDLAAREPERYLVLDASRPAAELAGQIQQRVAELLQLGGAVAQEGAG
ncbi:dTMP kinase [Ornithinimicrobium pratense]|uniref:Thymidylate kinase n=1 Tax=Ornithinimicrobium pratense TaxID=2593973 RepID=A0A5J6V1G5_9MICO|nr:dTMP kinase [Ornithinimicrobium pratense]QFG67609.1 dTMP kinase [Ornithinimicrobium pratense]